MPEYILLLHEDPSQYEALSPSDMQAVIEKYKNWSAALAAKGQLKGGHKLQDGTGRSLRRNGSATTVSITDGPYAESKEVIGGLFHITAASYDEAVEISRTCPHVEFGVVEIREIEVV